MNELNKLREENEKLKKEIIFLKSKFENKKKSMVKKAKEGKIMSRPPFGYKMENNSLVPADNSGMIERIFLEFKENELSMNKFSKKHNLTINGLKKILTNFTYLGKIKFNGEIHSGTHKQLISTILFNQVQDKLERLGIKKIN
jgi:hypothetical protein